MEHDQHLSSRILEPEVMDTAEEAAEYDAMDHSEVNRLFVDDLLMHWGDDREEATLNVLDVGTGTALIPIELAERCDNFQITAIDLSSEMLKLAEHNVTQAGLADRVVLKRVDAKRFEQHATPYQIVMSNSIVHHLPDPTPALTEMVNNLSQGGLLFVRDLMRPAKRSEAERLVATYAAEANDRQRSLFYDSLCAALTLAEIEAIVQELPLSHYSVEATSDRHWTIAGWV